MKVLVTGGAGYIGSRLVPRLLNEGHEVTVLDNFMYNQSSLLDCCYNPNLKVVRGDARNKDIVQKHISNKDFIFPLACVVGAPACKEDPVAAKSTNHDAIEMLLGLKSKDQKIIFPTTNSGYGIGQKDKYCTEETPLLPISLYGQTKVEAEKKILESGNAITLRLATVFGISPRMRLDLMVNDFVYRALTDRSMTLFEAHFKRNFIYIGDVVNAFVHCMQKFETMKDQTFNVGLSSANLSKWELCEEIKKKIPEFWFEEYKGADWAKDPDQRDYIVSNDKIEATGFKPKTTLQEGIEELIKGYQIIRRNQFSNL